MLDNADVRCWGFGGFGRLGYGNFDTSGDDETRARPGRWASALAGRQTQSASGMARSARAWTTQPRAAGAWEGTARSGTPPGDDIGDDETPDTAAPVDLGAGRTAAAVSTGRFHTCARLDDASVRCWGQGANGLLGYCNTQSIGGDDTPAAAGPVDLGSGGAQCADRPEPRPAAAAGSRSARP